MIISYKRILIKGNSLVEVMAFIPSINTSAIEYGMCCYVYFKYIKSNNDNILKIVHISDNEAFDRLESDRFKRLNLITVVY